MAIGLGIGILLIVIGVARVVGLAHRETPSALVQGNILVR